MAAQTRPERLHQLTCHYGKGKAPEAQPQTKSREQLGSAQSGRKIFPREEPPVVSPGPSGNIICH